MTHCSLTPHVGISSHFAHAQARGVLRAVRQHAAMCHHGWQPEAREDFRTVSRSTP